MKKVRHFVFDTSVLISAMLFPDSLPALSLKKAFGLGVVVVSEECVEELSGIITNKKFDRYVSFTKRQLFLLYFSDAAIFIDVKNKISACRDPDDDKFISLAFSANAECIITGDDDLLVLHPFRGISIITPSQFLSENK